MERRRSILCARVSLLGLGLWLVVPGDSVHAAGSPDRSTPPAGLAITASDRSELESGAAALSREIESLRASLAEKDGAPLRELLPDVEVYHKAVHWALAYDEFFRSNEVALARALLRDGQERARQLRAGAAPWLTATGLVIRGYVSRIDGSVQPYGLVVPASFAAKTNSPRRLDVWLHGRDNHLTELKFLGDRRKSYGEFTPPDTFVLHPYGRYCNAFKFAGETDVFESLEHVRRNYPIDDQRLAVRGFSMGGAGCWHLAAHHAGRWVAAAPGAGFAETAEYTKALTKEAKPPQYEQELWRLYDATEYAANLFNCPTIAYSGALDKQKQAADIMDRAMQAEGLELTHLLGPGVEHKYEPKTQVELGRRIDELVSRGRERWPKRVRFTTWTLRYHRMEWVTIEGLEHHWRRARVEAEILSDGFGIKTTNVSELTLAVAPELTRVPGKLRVRIDGQELRMAIDEARARPLRLRKSGTEWAPAKSKNGHARRKRPGLQGPIDDAFQESFLVVRPTGPAWHPAIGDWVSRELARATNEWRAQFRGLARVKDDVDVSDADIAAHHLVLWGDPRSNRLLARIAGKLPVDWTAGTLRLGEREFLAAQHVPVLIFPNPLNPERYVVLNSGFTFSDFGSASNAQQTPKLPDYAVIDVTAPRTGRGPDGVAMAGFFGERWDWSNSR